MNRTLFALAPFALVCASFAPGLLPPSAAAAESGPRYLLGRLTEQHVRVCAGGEASWEHAHFEAGFVWLLPEPGVDLAPLVGKPVLLEGEPAAPPPEAREPDPRQCPQVQARSDYVFGKDGVRLRREMPEASARAAAFRVRAARALGGVTLSRAGDRLVAAFSNELPVALEGLSLRLHYEGCYGKPGAPTESKSFSSLAPKKTARAEFPLTVTHDYAREVKWVPKGKLLHVPASLQIICVTPQVICDLDLAVALFEGAAIECPDRARP